MHEQEICLFEGDALEHRALGPRGTNPAEPRSTEAILAQIEATPPSVFRFVITGGRPLAHPAFGRIVECVRGRNPERLALETDGASLDEATLLTLVERGVSELFVHAGGLSERAHANTLRAGSARESLEGLLAACSMGITTYAVVTPTRANAGELLAFIDWLRRFPRGARGLLLALPDPGLLGPRTARVLLPPGATAELAARVFDKCERSRLEYGFRSRRGLAPCVTGGALDRYGGLFHDRYSFFKRGEHAGLRRVRACATCSLRDTCKGLETEIVETYGEGFLRPIPLERSMAWKLRELNTLDRREYKNVSPFKNGGSGHERGLLRINGHCNMSCAFCFVDRTAPDFAADGLLAEIDAMLEDGKQHIVISGGEPSLHPDLPKLIRRARERGARVVEIQTNGVRSANLDYASELVDAGLNKVTVSLHSADADHSDAITQLPNAFPKTVQAIRHFRALGVETQIAHVITKSNYQELPATIRFLSREFPPADAHLSICLAIAQGISDLVYGWVVPRFSEIRPYVEQALDGCLEHGIGFGGMIGQGGYPPCMLGGKLEYYEKAYQHLYLSDDWNDQFYKAPRCSECAFDPYCLGVRKSYVDSFGDAEIQPFSAPAQRLPPAPAVPPRAREALVPLRLGRDAR
ncbi:MAG TPA: radical SAM protein [Polyangiaceae bacterium]